VTGSVTVPRAKRSEARASAPPDPQAELLDAMTDEQVLSALGPDWSTMTPRAREQYGPRRFEADELVERLVRFARSEAKLASLEAKYPNNHVAAYRAALRQVPRG
jgi:hypothetical protein